MTAIRKHVREFAAILGLILLALVIGGYIASQERLRLPGWVPLVGQSFFVLKADLGTAQAVTPGQGQTVDIAGVNVGEISSVELKDGRALVSMNIKPSYAAVYHDATLLLRPKTGLKDMIVELSPGDPTTGKLRSGDLIPVQNTLPDVNPDEVLAALDTDSRAYLQLLANGGGQALTGQGPPLSAALRRFGPTARDLEQITGLLGQRRDNLRRVVHNFSTLSVALGAKDQQLAGLVTSSNQVFAGFARQEAALRASLGLLPGDLQQTQTTLAKVNTLAQTLGPTVTRLDPTARELAPALRQTRPFLIQTTPIIRDQLRPFSRVALPLVSDLRPAARDLSALMPNLLTSLSVVNELFNELAFNPGAAQPGFLFYLAWANHDANAVFATQDAQGPIRRGLLVLSCSSLGLLNQVSQVNPAVQLLVGLLKPGGGPNVCPTSSGAPG